MLSFHHSSKYELNEIKNVFVNTTEITLQGQTKSSKASLLTAITKAFDLCNLYNPVLHTILLSYMLTHNYKDIYILTSNAYIYFILIPY